MALPSREKELTNIPIYTVPRGADKYARVLSQVNVFDGRYIRDNFGTWCNLLVHDVLRLCDCPIPRVGSFPKLANDMADYWRDSIAWTELSWMNAVSSAMLGRPTVACLKVLSGHGHVSMVLPANAASMGDMLTMQAGTVNFYGRHLVKGYGEGNLERVKFYGHS